MTEPGPTVSPAYDVLGIGYARTRRADPRVAAVIRTALGDAASVVDVGAGAGSYEPPTTVVAVEPSAVMIAQRGPGAAPAVRGVAEALPLRDGSVDAALASLTVHHWVDVVAGLREMRRVARRRAVVFTWHPDRIAGYWLLRDYLPGAGRADAAIAVPLDVLTSAVPAAAATITPVPVPHDCTDGFVAAYWRRPEAYLDPQVRAGMSLFSRADPAEVEAGLARLAADLADGTWAVRNADLLGLDSVDVGYCLVTLEW